MSSGNTQGKGRILAAKGSGSTQGKGRVLAAKYSGSTQGKGSAIVRTRPGSTSPWSSAVGGAALTSARHPASRYYNLIGTVRSPKLIRQPSRARPCNVLTHLVVPAVLRPGDVHMPGRVRRVIISEHAGERALECPGVQDLAKLRELLEDLLPCASTRNSKSAHRLMQSTKAGMSIWGPGEHRCARRSRPNVAHTFRRARRERRE